MKYNEFFEYPDEPEKSRWTKLGFGTYIGKTLPQVMFTDPDWFFWAYNTKKFKDKTASEARLIHSRAVNIRIPQGHKEELIAEYSVYPASGKFSDVSLIPKSHIAKSGYTMRKSVLDMSVPSRLKRYDKAGNKTMIAAVKTYILRNPKAKMTKERCEAFFDDLTNFAVRN